MVEPVQFPSEITLAKHEALDLVAACDELLDLAEARGHVRGWHSPSTGCAAWCWAACWAKPAKVERGSGGWAAPEGGDVLGAEHEVTLDVVGGERAAVDEVVEVPCRDVQSAGGLAAGEPVLVHASVGPSYFHSISLYHRSEGCPRSPGWPRVPCPYRER